MTNQMKPSSQKVERLEKEGHDIPLLDLSDTAVREMIRTAEKRGYVTDDQIHTLLASQEVNSEQLENILAKLSEMGINVVESKEARVEEEAAAGDEPQEEQETGGENELVEVQQLSRV
jgi:RNA polymerase primary sigma factor